MTAPLWLPSATIVKADRDGGSMLGNDAYVTWHTFECDYTVPAVNGARVLNSEGFAVHIVFHPITGDTVAMIPANRAGRGLLNEAGGVETNRQGRVNIQIEVIGRASRPWTKDLTAKGRASLARILAWLDDLGVPRTAPNGLVGPTTYAASTKRARSVKAWNGPGGYFCHADVPENDHWDHGAIDIRDLWAVTAPTQSKEDDMPLTDAEIERIADKSAERLLAAQVPSPRPTPDHPTWSLQSWFGWTGKGGVVTQDTVVAMAGKAGVDVDEAALAAALAAQLAPQLKTLVTDAVTAGGSPEQIAQAVVDKLGAALTTPKEN